MTVDFQPTPDRKVFEPETRHDWDERGQVALNEDTWGPSPTREELEEMMRNQAELVARSHQQLVEASEPVSSVLSRTGMRPEILRDKIKEGELLAFQEGDEILVPSWQIDNDGKIVPNLKLIFDHHPGHVETIHEIMTTPNQSYLGGRTVVEALQDGDIDPIEQMFDDEIEGAGSMMRALFQRFVDQEGVATIRELQEAAGLPDESVERGELGFRDSLKRFGGMKIHGDGANEVWHMPMAVATHRAKRWSELATQR